MKAKLVHVCNYNYNYKHLLFVQPIWVQVGRKAISRYRRCVCHYVDMNSKFVQNPNKLYFAKVWRISCFNCPHYWIPCSIHQWCPHCMWATNQVDPKTAVAPIYLIHETWQCCYVRIMWNWSKSNVWNDAIFISPCINEALSNWGLGSTCFVDS